MFQERGVTDQMYLKTMPKFFEWAAKKDGGYDSDFLAVAERMFDYTATDMNLGNSYRNMLPWEINVADRPIFYARAYGKIEAIRSFMWDHPAAGELKQRLIESSRQSIVAKYSLEKGYTHPLSLA
jgi:hypothetical protein